MKSPKALSFFNFICVFFLILGWKILLIDLSVIIPAILLVVSVKHFHIDRLTINFVFGIFCLCIYQISLQIFLYNIDVPNVLRLIRTGIACILVALLFSNAKNKEKLLKYIILTGAINAFLILLAVVFPSINQFLMGLSDNSKIVSYRSSGLLAGYDIAGLFSVFCMVLIIKNRPVFKGKSWLFFYLLIMLSCFFSSRTSGLLSLLISGYWTLKILFDNKSSLALKAMVFFTSAPLVGSVLILFVYVFLVSIGYLSNPYISSLIEYTYAKNSGDNLLSMFFLPEGQLSFLFGIGTETYASDSGFIKDMFRFGLVGIIYSIILYSMILIRAGKNNGTLLILFTLILVLNVKNSYFFVRGISPLFVMCCLYYFYKKRVV
ncbi:hypothetical protein [Glaciecola sp. 33A]|jgi:hypothetical protein|uniref:hypothetical protein n=1 Tax=Glaciecola sp. 33A TaxID=2057807 RepID=UPI000C344DE8|nr:hypothetical protein [Glaciecola sp. 33A]PKI02285.1 hypothetical protein CXF81_06385 [Glaciecola sp. 33A]